MVRLYVRTLRRIPAAPSPERVLLALPEGVAPVLLDSSAGGWSQLVWSPDRTLRGTLAPREDQALPSARPWPLADRDPAAELQAACAEEAWTFESGLPLGGGWMGWSGFECGHAYERFPWTPRQDPELPDFHFARYRRALVWTPDGDLLAVAAQESDDAEDPVTSAQDSASALAAGPSAEESAWLAEVDALLTREATLPESAVAEASPMLRPVEETGQAFRDGVARLRAWIADGELYQANLSHRLTGAFEGDPRRLYRAVRARQPTTMSAYWEDADGHALVSHSPERFLAVDGECLESRPIKGTAPRGRDSAEDAIQAAALESSEKEQAELTMIVDMVRNDLGRLAPPGAVEVVSVGEVERYPTLFHRTATVRARWDPKLGLAALWAATFPPASVTGAPKVRALRAIAELEQATRGPYCGALGWWAPGPRPRGDFSVLIRTAVATAGRLALPVGAGIVWDSNPCREWEETVLKGRYLVRP
jgi:para-aminobenzoate synthetase component 1